MGILHKYGPACRTDVLCAMRCYRHGGNDRDQQEDRDGNVLNCTTIERCRMLRVLKKGEKSPEWPERWSKVIVPAAPSPHLHSTLSTSHECGLQHGVIARYKMKGKATERTEGQAEIDGSRWMGIHV